MTPLKGEKGLAIKFFKVGLGYFLITLLLGVLMITGNVYGIFGPQGAKLAHVHAGLLGFVTLIIMGSMYQIVPTLTGTKLYGEQLLGRQYWLINLGVLGIFTTHLLVTGQFKKPLMAISGLIVIAGSLLFAYIIFKTLESSRSKIKPVTIPFFKAAIIYYLAALTMGFFMALFPESFAKFLLAKTAHAHLGTLGFITMTIFGAEYQMYPMLSLQKLWSEKWAKINYWSFTTGVTGFWISLILIQKNMSLSAQRTSTLLMTLFTALLLLSIYVFLINMLLTLKGAKWQKLDISVKYLFTGHVFLFITTVIGAAMAVFYHLGLLEWMINAGLASNSITIYGLIWTHAHLALIGFVTLTIMGAMYHLAPMLVWMEKYGPKMGKEKVPMIQELFSQKLAGLILIFSVIGLLGILIGQLYATGPILKFSAYTLAISGTLFTYAMYKVMW